MSDKVEREIEEILNRLDDTDPEEDMPDPNQGPTDSLTANARQGIGRRLPRVSPRRVVLASLVLVALVAAGLFFGLVYPSLGSAGSNEGEVRHESVGDQIGEGVDVDGAWVEGSSHAGEGGHVEGRSAEEHGGHQHGGGEHR